MLDFQKCDEVRISLAKRFDLSDSSGHDDLYPLLMQELFRGNDDLKALEDFYRLDCIEAYQLPEDSTWERIVDTYLKRLDDSLRNLNTESKKALLSNEFNRLQIAKLLQLNKFLATWEDIFFGLEQLGIMVEF